MVKSISLPSWLGGFDSLYPLHFLCDKNLERKPVLKRAILQQKLQHIYRSQHCFEASLQSRMECNQEQRWEVNGPNIRSMARKSNTRSKQPSVPSPLPEDEWNFERVAPEDLPACYLWEFWREKCRRDPSVGQTLDNLRREVQANDAAIIQYDKKEIWFHCQLRKKYPALPAEPAASVEIYRKFNLYLWSDINPLSTEMDGLANISEAYFPSWTFQSLDPVLRQILRGKATPKNSKGQLSPLEEIPTSHPTEPNQQTQEVESVSFKINWAHNDERIQEAFHEWLLRSRGDRKARLTRGLGPGKSVEKTFLKNLKALGALRLLTHYGSSTAAMEAVAKKNRSVFAGTAEWSNAKKHAESILQDFKILTV